jgi:hypothetical protein
MTKAEARKILAAHKRIRDAIASINTLTDRVVERDCERGTDDMQTAEYQNLQYFADTVQAALEESVSESDANLVLGA